MCVICGTEKTKIIYSPHTHTPTHTHPHTQVHASMDELLRKAPMILSTGSYSRAELQRRWNEWRGEVVRRRGAGEFTAHAELELLAAVSVECV